MLYQAYQFQSDLISPLRLTAQHLGASLWLQKTERTVVRKVAAACDVIARLRLTHSRPPYNIGEVMVGDQAVPVIEEAVLTLPFGTPRPNHLAPLTCAPLLPPATPRSSARSVAAPLAPSPPSENAVASPKKLA